MDLRHIKRPARIYSNNFKISVLNSRHIDQATEEDIDHHLDEWARLFKAKTWEEVRQLAETNLAIKKASMTMYRMNLVSWLREFMQTRADADYDYHSAISNAEEAGEARGEVRGEARGRESVEAAMLSNEEDIYKNSSTPPSPEKVWTTWLTRTSNTTANRLDQTKGRRVSDAPYLLYLYAEMTP